MKSEAKLKITRKQLICFSNIEGITKRFFGLFCKAVEETGQRIEGSVDSEQKDQALPEDYYFEFDSAAEREFRHTCEGLLGQDDFQNKDRLIAQLQKLYDYLDKELEKDKYREFYYNLLKNLDPPQKKTVLFLLDKDYPLLLKNITDPPPYIFVWGDTKILNHKSISIVGTRNCSGFAKEEVRRIVNFAEVFQLTTVSGLANGVDTETHVRSLDASVKTIAVVPVGLDNIIPYKNRPLAKSIVDNGGAVITEREPGSEYAKYCFPLRNRIIAGLSRAVVVVEAPERSGALITANLACDYSREVFVSVRGVYSELLQGNFKLLDAEKASVLTPSFRILNQIYDEGYTVGQKRKVRKIGEKVKRIGIKDKLKNFPELEREILRLVLDRHKSVGAVVSKLYEQGGGQNQRDCGYSIVEINKAIVQLQLKRVLTQDDFGNLVVSL